MTPRLTANYHTHTPRCQHARGTEREFIEAAIANGIKTLGFADHSPQLFKNGFVSGIRMLPEQLPGYVDTLVKLREEYKDKIEILIGLEAEYYPDIFDDLIGYISQFPIDYLIMGQHYLFDESTSPYVSLPNDSEDSLADYADQLCEGMRTGKFAYVAHPDLKNYVGPINIYEKHMSKICLTAKELDIPLEINVLGLWQKRIYPSEKFWRLAGEIGNTAIIGCDAHSPDAIYLSEFIDGCFEIAEKYGVKLTESIRMTMKK